MGWTEEQLQAITLRGKNILVAAGAGSGKTAVMVERVIRILSEGEASIDEMLIVTFTNVAAAEMRERIRSALKKESGAELRAQIQKIPQAAICTFDSFFLQVIQRFFYLTDLEPGFRVADQVESQVLMKDSLDELFRWIYASEDPAFTEFLDWYSGTRDEEQLKTRLEGIYGKVMALPDPVNALEEKVKSLDGDLETFCKTETFRNLCSVLEDLLKKAAECEEKAEDLLRRNDYDKQADAVEEEKNEYRMMAELAGIGEISSLECMTAAFQKKRIRKDKDRPELFEQVNALRDQAKKKILDKQVKSFFYKPFKDRVEDLQKIRPQADTLLRIIKELHRIYQEKKTERKVLDFSDLSHRALEILRTEEGAGYYRRQFRYIFIDEYQDTNLMQEAVIGRIKRNDNLFLVGDIKQSIYRFRLAEPTIFSRRYREYAEEMETAEKEGREPVSVKIDLNRNFRSRPEVLEEINNMFRDIMPGYDQSAELRPGIPEDPEFPCRPETVFIDIRSLKEIQEEKLQKEAQEENEENFEDSDDIDALLEELDRAEREGMAIAELIRNDQGKAFHDTKTGEIRHLTWRDFVILARSVKKTAISYSRILGDAGIPLYVDDNDGYFQTMEIGLFLDLLSLIDNRYQDLPLIAVLHSGIYGFSAEDLACIRAAEKEKRGYTQAFLHYAEREENELALRARKVLRDIERWRILAASIPLQQFIWGLMNETGFYVRCGALPDGVQRQANLRQLVEIAEQFQSRSQNSLYHFLRYLDLIRKYESGRPSGGGGIRMAQSKIVGESENVVRLMTIHHSKGLEFPVVILSRMGDKLLYDHDANILFDRKTGIGMWIRDREHHMTEPSLLNDLIVRRNHQEDVEEEKRVLYVAVTRAQEKLYLLGEVKDARGMLRDKENGISGDQSLFEMLCYIPSPRILESDTLLRYIPEEGNDVPRFGRETEAAPEVQQEVRRRLNFYYPYSAAQGIRPKVSVSEVNRMRESREQEKCPVQESSGKDLRKSIYRSAYTQLPEFLQTGERRLTAAEKGTVYHRIMENLDFRRVAREGAVYIRDAAEEMVRSGVIMEEMLRQVDLEKIKAFFDTDIGRRACYAAENGRLKKEQPFVLRKEEEREMILIQGVIDCFFEEKNGIILVDYKSNRLIRSISQEKENQRLLNMYREQIALYREALEKGIKKPVNEAYLYLFNAERFVEVEK